MRSNNNNNTNSPLGGYGHPYIGDDKQGFWDIAEKLFKDLDGFGIIGGAATVLLGSMFSVRKLFRLFKK
jgi:hypothetical protein